MNKFEEALEKSRKETRERRYNYLQLQRKQLKKEHKKELIISAMFLIGLVIMIGLAMKLGQNFMNDCTSVHSQAYCEKGL